MTLPGLPGPWRPVRPGLWRHPGLVLALPLTVPPPGHLEGRAEAASACLQSQPRGQTQGRLDVIWGCDHAFCVLCHSKSRVFWGRSRLVSASPCRRTHSPPSTRSDLQLPSFSCFPLSKFAGMGLYTFHNHKKNLSFPFNVGVRELAHRSWITWERWRVSVHMSPPHVVVAARKVTAACPHT